MLEGKDDEQSFADLEEQFELALRDLDARLQRAVRSVEPGSNTMPITKGQPRTPIGGKQRGQ